MANLIGTINPDILTGTVLADTVQGLDSDDVLYGFDGNDLLQGGSGDDLLYGGSGDDLMDGGAGEDLFFGQSGRDTVSYVTALAGLVLNLADASQSTGDALGDWFLSVETFVLTGFDDSFVGSALSDEARGGAGNDLLLGQGGNDQLLGEAGNDTLEGGAGADALFGGAGVNLASYAASTSAVVMAVADMANATGDAAGDSFAGIQGLVMTGFADAVTLGGVIFRAEGGAGNDTLNGASGRDTLLGGADDDSIRGNDGNDQLLGELGNDRLLGGLGGDALFGGAGSDTLLGGGGADVLDGGEGIDEVVYALKTRLDLGNPGAGTGEAKGDTLAGVEVVSFGGAGSVFVGAATTLLVELTGTSLTCLAGSAAEIFSNLSDGALTVSYENAASAVTLIGEKGVMDGTRGAAGDQLLGATGVTLSGFADVLELDDPGRALPLTILAGNGRDTVFVVTSIADLIDLGGGNDDLSGAYGAVVVSAGAGDDVVDITPDFIPSIAEATVSGGAGNDQLTLGGFGSSSVDGGDGADLLEIRGEGLETVVALGGAGNDAIEVKGSNVNLDGGLGDDLITFNTGIAEVLGGDGNDTITGTAMSFISEMDGAGGNDVLTISGLAGAASGGVGDDQVTFILLLSGAGQGGALGGEGNDVLTLDSQFIGTVLPGNAGLLDGGAGNDTLVDQSVSSFVATQFRFGAAWGQDTVQGFSDGADQILFQATSPSGLDSFDDLTITGDASETVITFGSESITLMGFDLANFTLADVAFV